MLGVLLGFRLGPVTFITLAIYLGLLTGLLYVHNVVPSAPNVATPIHGINITEAWLDLQHLTNGYHPYNSHQNDVVRSWLLSRIDDILIDNRVNYVTEHDSPSLADLGHERHSKTPSVIVINDLLSNATYSLSSGNETVYFEGTNVIVYVRGSEDGHHPWKHRNHNASSKYGVLVNAHYDSVSTGFGATDDGVGVVSILQLIRYFTTPGNQPKRGFVALLNNGEEDYLNGARAFTQHPISAFPDTFLNLEGAGAGGRALLFRSTDAEVTQAYKNSPHPFGDVLSADAFRSGLVRSATDYSIFTNVLGMRGLDVAFLEPRSRYHTSQDDVKHTSKNSLWHMLSAAISTTRELTSDTTTNFKGSKGSDGVWFDTFGHTFAIAKLSSMFGLSVALLIIGPNLIGLTLFFLHRSGKWYLFILANGISLGDSKPNSQVLLGDWKGFFRYPIAYILASIVTLLLSFWVSKVNPNVIMSSPYSIWAMTLSSWLVVAWIVLKGADLARPSALQRAHSLGWLYAISWIFLVVVATMQNGKKFGGGYIIVILNATSLVAALIAQFELFSLPRISDGVLGPADTDVITSTNDLTETSSLLQHRTAFRRHHNIDRYDVDADDGKGWGSAAFGQEQSWSGALPNWVWTIQFLILGPINIILAAQSGLLLTSALTQTLADGNPAWFIYGSIAGLSVLLMMPISPFLHRLSNTVPVLFFFVLLGTLIYNLTAFPFSEQNRLKVFFVQQIDLDTGLNRVSLTGLDGYVQDLIAEIPSAAGQDIICSKPTLASRRELQMCSWPGLGVHVNGQQELLPPWAEYPGWVTVDTKLKKHAKNEASIEISGRNSRACKLQFETPIVDFEIAGAAAHDDRFPKVPKNGAHEIRLWSRQWDNKWNVHVKWNNTIHKGLDGQAVCLWSDQNDSGTIPALEEVQRFLPSWAIVSKLTDGLVEGKKSFLL